MPTTQEQILENKRLSYSKVVLCAKFIQSELTMFQDTYDKEKKKQLNLSIKTLDRFIRMIDPEIRTKDEEIDQDIEFMNNFFEASMDSEIKKIEYKFKNDFFKICKENNLKTEQI